jgi:hypothetical protein
MTDEDWKAMERIVRDHFKELTPYFQKKFTKMLKDRKESK